MDGSVGHVLKSILIGPWSCHVCGAALPIAWKSDTETLCIKCLLWSRLEMNKVKAARRVGTAPGSTKLKFTDLFYHQSVGFATIPLHGEPSPVTGKRGYRYTCHLCRYTTHDPADREAHRGSQEHLENERFFGEYGR